MALRGEEGVDAMVEEGGGAGEGELGEELFEGIVLVFVLSVHRRFLSWGRSCSRAAL